MTQEDTVSLPDERALWDLDPDVLHLNHGSFGAVPRPVRAAQDALRAEIEANPNRFYGRELRPRLEDARRVASAFLGADPDGVTFVENATTGVAAILHSIGLRENDEILLTDHGYDAVRLAAREIARRTGAGLRMTRIPIDTYDAASVIDAVSERTRLVVIDQITSPTALRVPVEEIVPALRRRGVACIVDGAHVPGMMDARLAELDPDYWVGNFHKWASAPRGAAALYVRPSLRHDVTPLVVSHDVDEGFPAGWAFTGTRDYTPFLCVPTALSVMQSLGWTSVRERNRALALAARDLVADALGATPPYPDADNDGVSMTLVPLPDGVATTREGAIGLIERFREELGAETAVVPWGGRGFIRLSAQAYNRIEDYERFAHGLRRFAW